MTKSLVFLPEQIALMALPGLPVRFESIQIFRTCKDKTVGLNQEKENLILKIMVKNHKSKNFNVCCVLSYWYLSA